MRIRLRERDSQTRRWHAVIDQRVSINSCTRIVPHELSESSDLHLEIKPDRADGRGSQYDARILIGNFAVASTLEKDKPDYVLRLGEDDDGAEYYYCSGRMLRDWAGQTELRIEIRDRDAISDDPTVYAWGGGDSWTGILSADLYISAGKLEQEAFEALCSEVADYSAGMLLDVYGKTFVNLELERRPGENAPVMVMQRLRHVIDQMASSLRAIARRPAYRLKTQRVREPALADLAVNDLTLDEVCVDPSLAAPLANGSVHFLEHVREVASPTFDLPENRIIAGFLHFLTLQARDLRRRMEHEVHMREDRREYRHRRRADGGKTWWESEDLPRIEELRVLLNIVATMGRELAELQQNRFLPAAPPLRHVPPSTPLLRYHKAYSSAFKTIAAHYQAFRVQVDDKHLVMRARSLPVLYEWWCLLEVMRSLRACLRYSQVEDFGPNSPFRRLAEERDRFVLEFQPDQAIDFEDASGRVVRCRYVPSYHGLATARGSSYGLLAEHSERTPDIALEIFRPGEGAVGTPELIVVLDAKYSSEAHPIKLDEVSRKYGKIGVFQTGKVLSRQVWALTTMPASSIGSLREGQPEWGSYCTVDNIGFWSDEYDMSSFVAGVVQARPKMLAGRSPLDSLLRLLLKRAGVVLCG